jgi:hypothetical protein
MEEPQIRMATDYFFKGKVTHRYEENGDFMKVTRIGIRGKWE